MRAIATIGTEERIEPKMGTRLMVAAIPARRSRYFTWKIQRPKYVKVPFSMQMTSWPRMTPESPRSIPLAIRS